MRSGTIERVLAHDRLVMATGLLAVTVLAWLYIAHLAAGGMGGMHAGNAAGMSDHTSTMAVPNARPWHAADLALTFLMWSSMMVAMMTPAVSPVILAFSGFGRRRATSPASFLAQLGFLPGYLTVWTGFSAAATALQWAIHSAGVSSADAMRAAPAVGGGILIIAGAYQLTPLRHACLSHCRSPFDLFITHWREGARGAFVMGVRHGLYCLGCCWSLMLVLFAAGIMNLVWVAAIAAYVLIEKSLPVGRWLGRPAGLLLIAWGGWLVASGIA